MIRLLFFILLLFGLGFFIQQGANDAGEAIIRWHGYELRMQATFLASAIAFFCIVFFFGGQLWAFLMQAPYTFERWRYKRRYEQGFSYFLEGLEALSAGEHHKAKKLAEKTQGLLPDKRLSHVLSADSASLNGQTTKAIGYYKELAQSSKGQFIGLKGLIDQAIKQADWQEVQTYALQAYLLKPKSSYVVDNLFQAHLHLKSFKEALTFIPVVQKHGSYTSEKLDEDESFIYIAMAKLTSGKDKLKLLEKSLKAQKNCIPAIRNMVEIYISNQDIKKALKVLNAFFQHTADLSVYALWVDIIKDEDSKYYKRRLKALLKGRDNTFVGYFIQGKELIRQLKLPEALTFLKKADALHSCKQVDILMATAASSIEGHEQEVKDILVKLEKSETYVFEGHDLLQSYQSWQETYIESSKVQIGKPSKYLSLLTKRSQ